MNKSNLIALASALALASCGGGEAAGEAEAEADRAAIMDFMENTVQPTAEVYWGSAGWIVDEEGEHDLTPTTEEGWAATLKSTQELQAQGELLLTPLYAEGRGEDWTTFAQAMIDVSKQAEQTAIDRDSDAIFETGGILYNVCRGCHTAYAPEEPPIDDPAAVE